MSWKEPPQQCSGLHGYRVIGFRVIVWLYGYRVIGLLGLGFRVIGFGVTGFCGWVIYKVQRVTWSQGLELLGRISGLRWGCGFGVEEMVSRIR